MSQDWIWLHNFIQMDTCRREFFESGRKKNKARPAFFPNQCHLPGSSSMLPVKHLKGPRGKAQLIDLADESLGTSVSRDRGGGQ